MRRILVAAIAACLSSAAFAQQAGDNVVSLGWFHIAPIDSSSELTTDVAPTPIMTPLRLPDQFTSSGTSLTTNNADTVGLLFTHFFSDNIAVTTVAGVPPTFQINGNGIIKPPGPAGALGIQDLNAPGSNPLVKSVRQWSPAALLQFYFGKAADKFRPFIGFGASYNFFTDIQLNPAFINYTQQGLGAVLAAGAGKSGPTTVEAKASPSWQPVFNLGAIYNINKHWGIIASVTYIPLRTTSSLYIKAADGTELGVTRGTLSADPIISYLAVSYKF
jgi:outer membrane protein